MLKMITSFRLDFLRCVAVTVCLIAYFQPSSFTTADNNVHLNEEYGYSVNLTSLIYQYILICGHGYLCDNQKFLFPYMSNSSYKKSGCPDCKCDRKCVIRGDCCPDVIFAYSESECISTTVLRNSKNRVNISNIMVDSCPTGSKTSEKEKCMKSYKSDELIQTVPVTSLKYIITFKNRYCAHCNNVTKYTVWSLDFKCLKFADFNFVSSYSEMASLAKEKDCSIEYKSSHGNTQLCNNTTNNQSTDGKLIAKCNVTGHWMNYDSDIAHACHSDYVMKFEFYKNVFCSLCNPPKGTKGREIISLCSKSLNIEGNSLKSACTKLGYVSAAYPFKNIFCRLCNLNENDQSSYKDANASVQRSIRQGEKYEFKYEIKIHSMEMDYYKSINNVRNFLSHAFLNSDARLDINNNIVSKTDQRYALRNLILNDYSLKGIYSYCVGNWTPYVFLPDDCSCDLSCFFSPNVKCCLDLLLTAPVSCYPDARSGKMNDRNITRFMVDGCFQSSVEGSLKQSCENPDRYDVFGLIPVYDKVKKIVYRSFACYLCNQEYQRMNKTLSNDDVYYVPWSVNLSCESDINVHFHVLISDILTSAKDAKCSIDIQPLAGNTSVSKGMNKYICTENTSYISKCNTTGSWELYDADIVYGCEKSSTLLPTYLQYKNIFCFMCNPTQIARTKKLIDSCTTPAQNLVYGSNIIQACETLPKIEAIYPYKNIFCKFCENNRTFKIPPKTGSSGRDTPVIRSQEIDIPPVIGPVLHDIFDNQKNEKDLKEEEEKDIVIKQVEVINTPVTHAWIYDHTAGKNRNLTCYPGKWLIGDKCTPLLPVTSHLRYTLAFALAGEMNQGSSPIEWLNYLMDFFKLKISEVVNASAIQFDSFHVISNISCNITREKSQNIEILLNTMFLVKENVIRLDVEERLNNMTMTKYVLANSTLSSYLDVSALKAPDLVQHNQFSNNCFVKEVANSSLHPDLDYRTSLVTNLLLCRQIELERSEYIIDNSSLKLSLKNKEYSFSFNKFYLVENGTARVCLEDFELAIKKKQISDEDDIVRLALAITNFVCTILSMVSLLITFITYCLFRPLRSVPGKNNMSLVFAMFFAQGLFQFGGGQTREIIACRIIGVLSHFFWLATFSCMGICSYHMYSVFSRSVMSRRIDNKGRKTAMFYNLIAYGGSLVVVTLSVIIGIKTMEGDYFGYGGYVCFLTSKISIIWSFLFPVILMCVLNVFFFVVAAIRIRSSPNVNSNQESKKNYTIYVKLFSVTGVTWLLLIIDTFVHKFTFFSFIVTVLNGCQGLYIFFSFCCNKRVVNLYRNLYKVTRKPSMMSYTTSTKSTSSYL